MGLTQEIKLADLLDHIFQSMTLKTFHPKGKLVARVI